MTTVIGYAQNKWNSFTQSEVYKTITSNWNELPQEPTMGRNWCKIEYNGKTYHQYTPTNDLYRAESHGWGLTKSVGALWCASYYYGLRTVRYAGNGFLKIASACHEIYNDHQAFKANTEQEYSFLALLRDRIFGTQESDSVFRPALSELKEAGRSGLVLLVGYIFHRYASYTLPLTFLLVAENPLENRVSLTKVENWLKPKGIEPLKEIKTLSVWQTVKHLSDGSYSLSQLFKIGPVESLNEENVGEEKEKGD